MKMLERYKAARRKGVPLVVVVTSDPQATIGSLIEATNDDTRFVSWDVARGLHEPVDGQNYGLAAAMGSGDNDASRYNPTGLLEKCVELPANAVIFAHALDRFYSAGDTAAAIVTQGIWNLRDMFKANKRMLVVLARRSEVPVELKNDVLIIDEPLPDKAQMLAIADSVIKEAAKGNNGFKVSAEEREETAIRVAGLAAFTAEQAIALSLKKGGGVSLDDLWDRKRKIIEQTRGLSVDVSGEKFSDVGGQFQIVEYATRMFKGPEAPALVCRIEEIEKVMSGAAGDTSGVSQDALQVLLNSMEDNNWTGLISFGPPGAGKSLFSKSLANTFGAMSIAFDISATKGSLVGNSEENIRQAIKVIKAIGEKRVFFVATANRLDSLPPELQRRFCDGTWMFDLPTADERSHIWKINRERFGTAKNSKLPEDDGYTGADIRNCCRLAYRLGCSLVEASKYLAPVSRTSPEAIERARRLADGRFLSSAYEGMYRRDQKASKAQGRALDMSE